MPLYTYQCTKCGYKDDVLEKVQDRSTESKQCPKCGETTFTRETVPHPTTFQLKGSGWFKDGY